MSWEYDDADRVECPVCNSSFSDEKIDEKGPTTNPENQAHFKALEHMAEEHEDELDRKSNPFPGLIPVGETE
ncbi:MAG: uncharacterized Zn finger protein (UPF0148 family) [Candidatus Nanohaloarchaea archaeon]